MQPALPEQIQSEAELDDFLSQPSSATISAVAKLASPLLILGASGKMGPSLCLLAKRAAAAAGVPLQVIAASRFSNRATQSWLEDQGVQTISVDLFNRRAVEALPSSTNVVYLVGLKFGTHDRPSSTWAANTLLPAAVAERFAGSRITALSTGNVYPFVLADSPGSTEEAELSPLGEYPNAAVARERIFEFYSIRDSTPITLLRLNYALDLRYGVLVDIARKVWEGRPVDVTMGFFNCIWQGDANRMILSSLELAQSPPRVLNITGASTLSVREIASQFGRLMNKRPIITGAEAETALLSNTSAARQLFGDPATPIGDVIRWTAEWIQNGGRLLGRPTHFEVRDGKY